MRAGNALIERYRIPADEVVRICGSIRDLGLKAVLLESGEDPTYTVEALCGMVEAIRSSTGLEVSLSVGDRPAAELRALKEAGADKYLLKHETSDSKLYERLHPEMSLRDRLHRLDELREIGYAVAGGSLVGLPGQTIHSLVEDLLLFQGYEVDTAVIGPYIPASGTPMELEGGTWLLRHALARSVSDKKHTVAEFVLKLIALTRLLLPESSIPSTTALASFLPQGREMGLMAGANMVMLNFTPARYKELFRVYDDRISIRETAGDALAAVRALGERLGRRVC
jgi:biotin synthase